MSSALDSSRNWAVRRAGSRRALSGTAVALVAAALITATEARAQLNYVLINNGLAPPNPANVVTLSDTNSVVLVRNVGCPPTGTAPYGSCASPGAPTKVEIAEGADLGGGSAFPPATHSESAARDSSIITMSGGSARGLSARESARVTVTAGTIVFLKAFDDSVLTLRDGVVSGYLEAHGNATVQMRGGVVGGPGGGGVTTGSTVPVTISGGTVGSLGGGGTGRYIIEGSNFAINGVPVGYGDYEGNVTLTGTWASGESFSTPIYSPPFTLAPPAAAVPSLPIVSALALAVALLAIGAARTRRLRDT